MRPSISGFGSLDFWNAAGQLVAPWKDYSLHLVALGSLARKSVLCFFPNRVMLRNQKVVVVVVPTKIMIDKKTYCSAIHSEDEMILKQGCC